MRHRLQQLALCVNNEGYPVALEQLKAYRVIPDREAESYGQIRVVDESGEDYLYPRGFFRLIKVFPLRRPDSEARAANGRNGGPRLRKPASRLRRALAARGA
jgi:hypothetical protein